MFWRVKFYSINLSINPRIQRITIYWQVDNNLVLIAHDTARHLLVACWVLLASWTIVHILFTWNQHCSRTVVYTSKGWIIKRITTTSVYAITVLWGHIHKLVTMSIRINLLLFWSSIEGGPITIYIILQGAPCCGTSEKVAQCAVGFDGVAIFVVLVFARLEGWWGWGEKCFGILMLQVYIWN